MNDDTLEGNILFNNGSLIRPMNEAYTYNLWLGPDASSHGLVVEGNATYFAKPWGRSQIGGESGRGVPRFVDSRLVGNLFADGYEVHLTNCEGTIRNNIFLGKLVWNDGGKARSADDFCKVHSGNTLHPDSRRSGTEIIVRPNRYESGRGHIAIYNWELRDSVEVDVSGILSSGDRHELRAVQDLLGIATIGICSRDTKITVPMERRRVAKPVGWDAPASTFPEFGAFLLQRVHSSFGLEGRHGLRLPWWMLD